MSKGNDDNNDTNSAKSSDVNIASPPDKKEDEKVTTERPMRLFSQKEVNAIVREFIRAYIRGDIKVNLPMVMITPSTPLAGMPAEEYTRVMNASQKRQSLKDLIAICTGINKVTSEAYRQAINALFELIVTMRMNNELDGTFLEYDIESRFKMLEQNHKELREQHESTVRTVYRIQEYVERIDVFRERTG
jgi:hypothetical protein